MKIGINENLIFNNGYISILLNNNGKVLFVDFIEKMKDFNILEINEYNRLTNYCQVSFNKPQPQA